jgi:hypothetical protein
MRETSAIQQEWARGRHVARVREQIRQEARAELRRRVLGDGG